MIKVILNILLKFYLEFIEFGISFKFLFKYYDIPNNLFIRVLIRIRKTSKKWSINYRRHRINYRITETVFEDNSLCARKLS